MVELGSGGAETEDVGRLVVVLESGELAGEGEAVVAAGGVEVEAGTGHGVEGSREPCTLLSQCITEGPMSYEAVSPV